MNKREKEVIGAQLDSEKKVLDDLRRMYQKSIADVEQRIRILQSGEITQSNAYQVNRQKMIMAQLEPIYRKLQTGAYQTINQYLSDSYTDAFVGEMYNLHGQGVPVLAPIDRGAMLKAIELDSKLQTDLYAFLGYDMDKLKKEVREAITRGIAANQTYEHIARGISEKTGVKLSNANRIARTEGHRIQQQSADDARNAAIAKGTDLVKQWDASLDGATREIHRILDGRIVEAGKPFTEGKYKAMFPGDFGFPEMDCNCRCVALSRARSALDKAELETLRERAAYFKLDKTDDFRDFREKYLKAVDIHGKSDTIKLPNIEIFRSLGAKATNYDITLPNGEHTQLTEGTRVTNIKVIAGKGKDRAIDEIDILVQKWNGNPNEWQKKKGIGYVDYQGESYKAELHWYEEPTAGRHKWKVKPDADGNWFMDDG